MKTLQADYRLCAYENAYGKSRSIHEVIEKSGSSLVVIGPEGGFSMEEVKELEEAGYTSITLGKRILRAETAALFSCSVLAELLEDNE